MNSLIDLGLTIGNSLQKKHGENYRKHQLMIKKSALVFQFLLFGSVLLACQVGEFRPTVDADPFYTEHGYYDEVDYYIRRFPLIKPYDATHSHYDGWGIKLNEGIWTQTAFYSGFSHITRIVVSDGLILAYSTGDTHFEIEKELHWFVIIPEQKIEVGFDHENDFIDYLQKYGVSDPKWLDPEDIFQRFDSTSCLEWISTCK